MKKIGIISLYYKNRNYGGLLQAFSLQKYLELKGYPSEQICFESGVNEKTIRLKRIRTQSGIEKKKEILRYIKYCMSISIRSFLGIGIKNKLRSRIESFEQFQMSIPHSKHMYTIADIAEANDSYDAFICGSDVIWNAGIPAYVSCLGFVNGCEKKKIAYAPSIGGASLPLGWIDEYKEYLELLDAISVRENGTKNILNNEMPALNIKVMPDPTFLLTKGQWETLLPKKKNQDKYIFCYLLGSSKKQRKEIKKLAKKHKLVIYTFPHIENNIFRNCDIIFGDEKMYSVSPLEFLNLIKNAELVVSDSFHAIVFSLLFNVNFRALPRMKKERESGMSARIINLLNDVKMNNYMVSNEKIGYIDLNEEQNFEYSNHVINKKRNEAETFLKVSLGDDV